MGEPFREAADQQAGLHPEATLVGPALGTGEDTGCRAGERGPALAEEAAAGAQGHGPASVHGILQARILEWVAMPSSRGSSRSRDRTCVS